MGKLVRYMDKIPLALTTSRKQIRRVVCSQSKIENRGLNKETNLICANAEPRGVVHSWILSTEIKKRKTKQTIPLILNEDTIR